MKNLSRVIVFVLLAGLLLSACAGPVNYLYGSWRSSASSPQTVEILQDGRYLTSSQGVTVEEFYQVTGENQDTLMIRPTKDAPLDQAVSEKFTITGDTLTITDSTGTITSYARLK